MYSQHRAGVCVEFLLFTPQATRESHAEFRCLGLQTLLLPMYGIYSAFVVVQAEEPCFLFGGPVDCSRFTSMAITFGVLVGVYYIAASIQTTWETKLASVDAPHKMKWSERSLLSVHQIESAFGNAPSPFEYSSKRNTVVQVLFTGDVAGCPTAFTSVTCLLCDRSNKRKHKIWKSSSKSCASIVHSVYCTKRCCLFPSNSFP